MATDEPIDCSDGQDQKSQSTQERAGGAGVVPGAVTKTRRGQPVGGRGRAVVLLVHESSSEDGAQGLAIRRFSESGTLARAGEGCRVELHSISVSCLNMPTAQRSDMPHGFLDINGVT